MAVASTYNQHTVLVGLGHLGYRVIQKLHEMEENVVVVEINPKVDTLAAVPHITHDECDEISCGTALRLLSEGKGLAGVNTSRWRGIPTPAKNIGETLLRRVVV